MSTAFHRVALESMIARALYLISRLALPPLVLSYVGLAEYGLWSIAFVLVGYLGISVSGLATVYVREIALAHDRDDALYASKMLSTGVALAMLVGGIFCTLVAIFMPMLLSWFKITPQLHALAANLLLLTCLIFLADLTLGAWGYVLNGLKLIHEQQRIWVASFILEWCVAAALLVLGQGINALLWAFSLRYALSISLSWWRVKKAWPALSLRPKYISKQHLQPFLNLGLRAQLSDSWALLLHSADRVIVGLNFGAAYAGLMDLGSKLPATATSITSGISQALMPHAASLDDAALSRLYQQAQRLAVFSLLGLMPLLVAMAPALNLAWLGPRPELAQIVTVLLWVTPAWHLHIQTGPASSALRGKDQIGLEFFYHGLRTLVFLVCLQASNLIEFLRILCIGQSLAALIYLTLASKTLQFAPRQLFSEIIKPLALNYILAYSFVWLWPWQLSSRSSAFAEMLVASCLFIGLQLGLLWWFILHPDEQKWLKRKLRFTRPHETYHA
ncbi:lipopolysaccharide biosynthesis protein [Deefgea salmonis]|uniref:Oligosaccharide flippase family protein n=1 Tax=Deefgea salmonis TaxID=2875502 RepID=A0ABS8BNN3_9NEIS|nr:oligosaccharide flippase family protein [Deefgea salmonis]MCB5197344.1 oligosaccharide flippase family protein [Deefgea salmonis]